MLSIFTGLGQITAVGAPTCEDLLSSPACCSRGDLESASRKIANCSLLCPIASPAGAVAARGRFALRADGEHAFSLKGQPKSGTTWLESEWRSLRTRVLYLGPMQRALIARRRAASHSAVS